MWQRLQIAARWCEPFAVGGPEDDADGPPLELGDEVAADGMRGLRQPKASRGAHSVTKNRAGARAARVGGVRIAEDERMSLSTSGCMRPPPCACLPVYERRAAPQGSTAHSRSVESGPHVITTTSPADAPRLAPSRMSSATMDG